MSSRGHTLPFYAMCNTKNVVFHDYSADVITVLMWVNTVATHLSQNRLQFVQ